MGVPQYSMPGRRKDYVSIERQRLGVGVPAGGAYNPNDKSSKKNGFSYSVKKSTRDGELGIFKNTPGSGAYHPDASLKIVKTASACWSMGSSKRPKQQHYVPPTPGPGQYEMRKTPGAETPGYSINKRPSEFLNQSPGPGAYQPKIPVVQQTAPIFSLGSQKRLLLQDTVVKNRNPGAGSHELGTKIGESPAFGFGSSTRKALKDDGQPGPGQYEYTAEVGDKTAK